MKTKPETELDLFTARELAATADPQAPDPEEVAWFVKLLHGAGTWMTAKDILLTLGKVKPDGNAHDDDKRWLRSLASATDWVLSGQKGYLHLSHASAGEIDRAANWLESQARKMGDRAGALRSNAHKLFASRTVRT